MPQHGLSYRQAFLLLAVVVLTWGVNWPLTKVIVRELSPLWSTALRTAVATVILALLLWLRSEFIVPRRGDVAVVLCTSLLHMTAYAALITAGLQYLPSGRAIVLGYTTPVWVTIGARLFLSEQITTRRAIGVALGIVGLALIFSPGSLDWSDRNSLVGSGLILLAAFCWAANIVYVRAHVWVSTPFQLAFWQLLLASIILLILAALLDGIPHADWSARLAALVLFGGIVCTALAHWAMAMVNRSLPAVTTSLGLLVTPLLGIVSGALLLGEAIEPSLLVALALIVGGIVVGIIPAEADPR